MKKVLGRPAGGLLLDLGADLVGAVLMTVGISVFTSPNQIAPGGVSGCAILTHYLTGLPIGSVTLGLNLPILLAGYGVLGRQMALNTLRSLAVITVVMDVLLADIPPYQGDPLLAALFGGVFIGLAMGVIFRRGSTTGGFDILVKIIARRVPHLSIGTIVLLTDMLVLLASAVVYGQVETVLYGLVGIYVSTKALDLVLYGADSGKYVTIVTTRGQLVADQIIARLNRSATLLPARGAYSGQAVDLVLCVVSQREFYPLKQALRQLDPRAFVIVSEATEILGEGFKPIHGEE